LSTQFSPEKREEKELHGDRLTPAPQSRAGVRGTSWGTRREERTIQEGRFVQLRRWSEKYLPWMEFGRGNGGRQKAQNNGQTKNFGCEKGNKSISMYEIAASRSFSGKGGGAKWSRERGVRMKTEKANAEVAAFPREDLLLTRD